MRFLRTNTAVRVTVGPFLDKTDGITPEVALTATNEKLTFMVDDGNVPTLVIDANATASGGSNDMVHVTGDDAGFYDLELTAAQTNYLGRALLAITYATDHCPVFHEFMILPAMIYDSLVLGTDRLDTNVTHVADTSQTARDIGASVLISSGTGTGQLSVSSGVIAANVTQVKGTTSAGQAGYVGIDWATVANQDTIVSLSATTISTVTTASNMITAATLLNSSAAGPYSANTWGSKLDTAYTNSFTLVAGVTVATGGITAASIATDAIGSLELADSAVSEITAAVVAALSGTDVTVSSPVADDGTIRIIQGDTYAYVDGRSFNFTFDATPGVTGATIVLKITRGGTTTSVTGTVLTSTTGYFERTSAQTAAMSGGEYTYEVEVTLSGGNVMTTHRGSFFVDVDI